MSEGISVSERNRLAREARKDQWLAEFKPLLDAAGFREMGSSGHYQLRMPGCPAIDCWPRKKKWAIRNHATHGNPVDLARVIAAIRRDPPRQPMSSRSRAQP